MLPLIKDFTKSKIGIGEVYDFRALSYNNDDIEKITCVNFTID